MKLFARTLLVAYLAVGLSGCANQHYHQVMAQMHHRHVVMKNDKEAAKANVKLAMAFLERGNTLKAKEKFLLAKKEAPKEPMIWCGLGYFYEKTGESQSAEVHYKKAVKLGGKKGEGHNNYGTFLCRQKRYQEAIHQFMLAVKDEDYLDFSGVYENAGMCALDIPNRKAAKHFFKKAIETDPNADIALYYMAKLAIEDKKYENADKYLTHLIEMEDKPIPQVHQMYDKVKKVVHAKVDSEKLS